MEKKKWDLAALASIPLIMTFGGSMIIPVLPTIEKKLNITSFQSSIIITIHSAVAIFLIPVAGFLSDRLGRKKVIIPSLIITAVGSAVSGWAAWRQSYWLLLTGRLIQGVGSSGAFPVVIPTVGDLFKSEKDISKGLGIIETSNTFGKVLSPILGSALALWIWFSPLLAISVFSLISILLVALLVKAPKDKKEKSGRETFKQFCFKVKDILKQNKGWVFGIFIVGFICTFALFGFLFYFSSALEDRHNIKGLKKGLFLAVPLLLLCMASFTTGKIIGRNKKLMKWMILAGNVVAAAALALLGLSEQSEQLVILAALLSAAGIGLGIALPSLDSLITEGIKKAYRGTVTCLYSSMRLLGVAFGPPATAVLMKSNSRIMFFALAGASALAAVFSQFLIKPKKSAA